MSVRNNAKACPIAFPTLPLNLARPTYPKYENEKKKKKVTQYQENSRSEKVRKCGTKPEKCIRQNKCSIQK